MNGTDDASRKAGGVTDQMLKFTKTLMTLGVSPPAVAGARRQGSPPSWHGASPHAIGNPKTDNAGTDRSEGWRRVELPCTCRTAACLGTTPSGLSGISDWAWRLGCCAYLDAEWMPAALDGRSILVVSARVRVLCRGPGPCGLDSYWLRLLVVRPVAEQARPDSLPARPSWCEKSKSRPPIPPLGPSWPKYTSAVLIPKASMNQADDS